MAEIDDMIKWILEMYTEEMFNEILYLKSPELIGLSYSKRLHIARCCASIGKNGLKHILNRDFSVQDLALKMGVRKICYFNEEFGKNGVRAYYEPSTVIIHINDNSILQQMNILKFYELDYFSRYDILNMHILHELFHHMEYTSLGNVEVLVKKRFNIDGEFNIFRDIAAFSFVNGYQNSFPCQIIDFLWKCYFYPELEWLKADEL